jgi:ferredoxin-thioredoxin reductase catalytic subunit
MNESFNETLQYLEKIAHRFNYALNPDEKALNRLVDHLSKMKAENGKYFCPCKQNYPLDTKTDPICPCNTFRDEVAHQGHCECHLFFDRDAAIQAKRRPGLLAAVECPG